MKSLVQNQKKQKYKIWKPRKGKKHLKKTSFKDNSVGFAANFNGKETLLIMFFFSNMGLYKEALPSLYSFPPPFPNICILFYISCNIYTTDHYHPPPSVKDHFEIIYEEDVLNKTKAQNQCLLLLTE